MVLPPTCREGHRRLFIEPLEGRRVLAGLSIVESGGSTSVGEAAGTDTIAVALTEVPLSNVVLNITEQRYHGGDGQSRDADVYAGQLERGPECYRHRR